MKKTQEFKWYFFHIFLVIFSGFIFVSIEFMLRVCDIDFIRPIRVVYSGPRAEDFREYHMFTDESFMPDPYLFWKIKPSSSVRPIGYMNKEFRCEKSKNVSRIFCLGDSFTMGTPDFSYPQELNEFFNSRPILNKEFEVINAGLSGYTSLQGYRSFSEFIKCGPDILIVCFGWNDGCFTKRGADKKFKPVNKFTLQLERFCYKFKIYQLLKLTYGKLKYAGHQRRFSPGASGRPVKMHEEEKACLTRRVDFKDYEQNLIKMIKLAKENNIKLILATRPCNLEKQPWMTSFVEDAKIYNDIMREVSEKHGIFLFDAEKIFWEQPEYFVDACHMNHEGYRLFAEHLYDILSKL